MYPRRVGDSDWRLSPDPEDMLFNTHHFHQCYSKPCTLHEPSDHHMREWPLMFLMDVFCFARTCPHGTVHPDPDTRPFDHECCEERCCEQEEA